MKRSRLLRALARPGEGGDHPVQRAHLLFGALRALQKIAEVAHHAWPLGRIAQESIAVELLLEVLEEGDERLLARRGAVSGRHLGRQRRIVSGESRIAVDQPRLGGVERGEGGIERY